MNNDTIHTSRSCTWSIASHFWFEKWYSAIPSGFTMTDSGSYPDFPFWSLSVPVFAFKPRKTHSTKETYTKSTTNSNFLLFFEIFVILRCIVFKRHVTRWAYNESGAKRDLFFNH